MSKKPKQREHPSSIAPRRPVEGAISTDKDTLVWSFLRIDQQGPFPYSAENGPEFFYDVFKAHHEFSRKTWSEIKRETHDNGKSKHHSVNASHLSELGRKRFQELSLDDQADSVFSLRLNNLKRIIGIRDGRIFYVLWYDPKHQAVRTQYNS